MMARGWPVPDSDDGELECLAFDRDSTAAELARDEVHCRIAKEARDARARGPVEDVLRRADLGQLALEEDGHPVGHRHRLLLVVGDVDRRHVQGALQLHQLNPRLDTELGIEIGEGLVEQEELGLSHDRPRQRHPLLLAARELARLALQQLIDPDAGSRIRHRLVHLALRGADHP